MCVCVCVCVRARARVFHQSAALAVMLTSFGTVCPCAWGRVGAPEDHMKLGREAGEEIREAAGEKFFEELMDYVATVQAANTKPTKVA